MALRLIITPELCKHCIHYVPAHKTCTTSVVALTKTTKYYDFAKSVRTDEKRCGPAAARFKPLPGMTGAQVNELLEADMR
jgi:hypothetical protein